MQLSLFWCRDANVVYKLFQCVLPLYSSGLVMCVSYRANARIFVGEDGIRLGLNSHILLASGI